MLVDRAKQIEKVNAMIGIVVEILGDHGESDFENGVKNTRDVGNHACFQLVDDAGEKGEDFGVASVRMGSVIITQDAFKKRGHKLSRNEFIVFAFFDKSFNQSESFL